MIEDDGGFYRNETRGDGSHLPPLPICSTCEENIDFCECEGCRCEGCEEGREMIAEGELADAQCCEIYED